MTNIFFSDEETARSRTNPPIECAAARCGGGQHHGAAILEGEDGYAVTIDGVTVATMRSPREALVQFAIVHYVLNMKVRAVTKTLMWFMSTKIMSLPEEGAAQAGVVADVQQWG